MPVPAVLPPALAGLPVRREVLPPEQLRAHAREGRLWPVALPEIFIPFASARPCSTRGVFCPETPRPQHV